jgi:hypothetical protein
MPMRDDRNSTLPSPAALAALRRGRRRTRAEKIATAKVGPVVEPRDRLLSPEGMLRKAREILREDARQDALTAKDLTMPAAAILRYLSMPLWLQRQIMRANHGKGSSTGRAITS